MASAIVARRKLSRKKLLLKKGLNMMLNMDIVIKRDTMCKEEKSIFGEYQIVGFLAAAIYSLHEGYKPKHVNRIMHDFVKGFRDHPSVRKIAYGHHVYEGTLDSLKDALKEILMGSYWFVSLNKLDKNGYFIDLDAVIQNVWFNLSKDMMCVKLFEGEWMLK